MSLDVAKNVDPEERRAAHVDDTQMRRNEQEVYGLSGKPEETGAKESRNEFLLALLERMFLHLHQRHSGEENHEQGRRQDELIEKQFPDNYLPGCAGKSSVKPLVPVVEDGRVNERAHDRVTSENGFVDVLRWLGL